MSLVQTVHPCEAFVNRLALLRNRAVEEVRDSKPALGFGLALSALAGAPMPLSQLGLVGPVLATLAAGRLGGRAAAAVGFLAYLAIARPSAESAIAAGALAALVGWAIPTFLAWLGAAPAGARTASAVVVDCDGFVALDAKYGPGTGEYAFGLLRRALETETRESDLVVQAEGRELVVVTDGSNPSATRSIMARVERRFSGWLADAGYECELSVGLLDPAPSASDVDDALRSARRPSRRSLLGLGPPPGRIGRMVEELRELWRYRELFLSMTQRELSIRYKNSALGFLWSFINPLLTALVMTLVFGKLLNNGVTSFAAYVLAALLPFSFFQAAVLDSAQSVLGALPIVRKVYFPREVLPLSIVASNFVHLVVGFLVFFVYLFGVWALSGFKVSPFQATTWLLPFLMVVSLFLATGIGLLVCALNTFYEDVKHLMNAAMYLLTFLCPIVYFYEQISDQLKAHPLLAKLYLLNPQAVLSICYRKALLAPTRVKVSEKGYANPSEFPWPWLAFTAGVSVVVLVLGYAAFNRVKWRFVERP